MEFMTRLLLYTPDNCLILMVSLCIPSPCYRRCMSMYEKVVLAVRVCVGRKQESVA